MPTLHWIGKEAVVNHHHAVPFHLLRDVPELSVGEPGAGNLIVQGDNLVALKALLPYYAGQVKCIYIDPPYNTGNEGWVYNDNANSAIIREWLGKAVGKEAEDLSRHDKWLCMMCPRLHLLKGFLRKDGVIFVSIDDNEVTALKMLMDDIFGRENFVGKIVWHNSSRVDDYISVEHEYVLVYFKQLSAQSKQWKKERIEAAQLNRFIEELRGNGCELSEAEKLLRAKIKEFIAIDKKQKTKKYSWLTNYANLDEDWKIYYPVDLSGEGDGPPRIFNGKLTPAPKGRHWMSQEYIDELATANRIAWRADRAYRKLFIEESQENLKGVVSFPTRNGGEELKRIFGKQSFDKPKPKELIGHLLSFVCQGDDIILDSFGGSGTTGHAVLDQNKADGGSRRFILVEMESNIARDITAERVKRVAQGYTNAKGEKVEGLGSGFRFCELGEPLFDSHGQLRESVTFGDLARHVYFTETGEPLPRERVSKSPLVGECRGVAVYLLFNGILGDKSANGGNILTRAVLAKLPKFDGPKVIYASGCLLGRERLKSEGITFRQTPYEIKVT